MAGLASSCRLARCYFHPSNTRSSILAVYAALRHVAKRGGIETLACSWRCWVGVARMPLQSLPSLPSRMSQRALRGPWCSRVPAPTRSEVLVSRRRGRSPGGSYSALGGLLMVFGKGGVALGRPCAAWSYFFWLGRNQKSHLVGARFLYSFSFFLVFGIFPKNRALSRMDARFCLWIKLHLFGQITGVVGQIAG